MLFRQVLNEVETCRVGLAAIPSVHRFAKELTEHSDRMKPTKYLRSDPRMKILLISLLHQRRLHSFNLTPVFKPYQINSGW